MTDIATHIAAAARDAEMVARDAFNDSVLAQYRTNPEFRAAVHAVVTVVAVTADPDRSVKIGSIKAVRNLFGGKLGLLGAKRLIDIVPAELFDRSELSVG